MMGDKKLTHINEAGDAHMVDVSDKAVTSRKATAEGFIEMNAETLALIRNATAKKGDVLATARIAGIMAAKHTHDLIPLCHPLLITKVTVSFDLSTEGQTTTVRTEATVQVEGKTGVEMEALTAVSVACLTIYDMLKAADKTMRITGIRLLHKSGGRSGTFNAE